MSAASVYRFDQLDEVEKELVGGWDAVRGLLGGKGANLAEMTRLGIPVPPGFTVTTQACLRYLADDNTMPAEVWEQVLGALRDVEQVLDKRFGDPTSPLLVSCRSGAKFSMPGMMDTVLNIGLNDDTAKGLVALTGDAHFVFDSYRRLIQMFGTVVLGLRDELFENVLASARVGARRRPATPTCPPTTSRHGRRPLPRHRRRSSPPTLPSSCGWPSRRYSPRGTASARSTIATPPAFPHDLGTAVNVQAMVFGNLGEHSRHRRDHDAQRGDRPAGPGGRLPHQRPGRGRRVRHPRHRPLETLAEAMPQAHAELQRIGRNAGEATTATCRTSSSLSRTASYGCCRRATASGPPRPPSASPSISPTRASSPSEDALRRVTPEPDRLLPPPTARRRSP